MGGWNDLCLSRIGTGPNYYSRNEEISIKSGTDTSCDNESELRCGVSCAENGNPPLLFFDILSGWLLCIGDGIDDMRVPYYDQGT